MGAIGELVDAWADLVHGAACVGCDMPGRPWCRSCAQMLPKAVQPSELDLGDPALLGACLGEYGDWIKAMILAYKEQSAWTLAAPLGELLAGGVASVIARGGWSSAVVLVAIPSQPRTVRARGHHPSLQMTRHAAHCLRRQGVQAQALPLLRLRRPVRDSVGLSAAERRRNLEDAFAVQPRARAVLARWEGSMRIVICDDVMTTGATIAEASAALSLAGVPAAGAVVVASVLRGAR